MTEYPHLSRAPITEAVLDIRVERSEGIALDDLASFAESVRAEYPERRQVQKLHAEFAMNEKPPSVRPYEPETIGHIFWNPEHTRAVQARIDGFTVNHVKQYQDWDALRDNAKSLWQRYVAVARPSTVVRCAVRFINRIELAPGVDLGIALITRPEVATTLPQLLDEYFMRIVIPFGEGRRAAITQATRKEPVVSGRVLGLDIDVFVKRTFDPRGGELWAEFEALRRIKNDCFFNSLQKQKWEEYL